MRIMNRQRAGRLLIAVFTLAVVPGLVAAQLVGHFSGFLGDYNNLERIHDHHADYLQLAPDWQDKVGGYGGVMVLQPMLYLHPDSHSKGVNPDAAKLLADHFRDAVIDELDLEQEIVDVAGDGVLILRFALSDLYLTGDWSRNPATFTPGGYALSMTPTATLDRLAGNLRVSEMTVEVELIDGATGDRLAALVEKQSFSESDGQEPAASWNAMENLLHQYGRRLNCRFNNARLAAGDRKDCRAAAE